MPGLELGIYVRPMVPGDVDAVVAMAAVVPTAPHWPAAEFHRMLRVIGWSPARRGAWVAHLDEGEAVGFAIASQVVDTAELEAVVTGPPFRRRGVGRELTEAVCAWARSCGAERLQLEARASNEDALRLYRRLGFRQNGVRTRYYRNPEEDAILMCCTLVPKEKERLESTKTDSDPQGGCGPGP